MDKTTPAARITLAVDIRLSPERYMEFPVHINDSIFGACHQ